MVLKLSRLSSSVALGLVLYFEWNTKDALMQVGAYFVKCNSLNDAYVGGQHVVLNQANIRLLRKPKYGDVNISGKDASLCKPRDGMNIR